MSAFSFTVDSFLRKLHLSPYATYCALLFLFGELFVLIPQLRGWTPLTTASEWIIVTIVIVAEKSVFGAVVKTGLQRFLGTVVGAALGTLCVYVLWSIPPQNCLACSWKPYVWAIVFMIASYIAIWAKELKGDWTYAIIYGLLTASLVGNTAYLTLVLTDETSLGPILLFALGRSIGILIGVVICLVGGIVFTPKAADKAGLGLATVCETLGTALEGAGNLLFLNGFAEGVPSAKEVESALRPSLLKLRSTLNSLDTLIEGSLALEFQLKPPFYVSKKPMLAALLAARRSLSVMMELYYSKMQVFFLTFGVPEDFITRVVESSEAGEGKEVDLELGAASKVESNGQDKLSTPPPERDPARFPTLSSLSLHVSELLVKLPTAKSGIEAIIQATSARLNAVAAKLKVKVHGPKANPTSVRESSAEELATSVLAFEKSMDELKLIILEAREKGVNEYMELLVVWNEMERLRAIVGVAAEFARECEKVMSVL